MYSELYRAFDKYMKISFLLIITINAKNVVTTCKLNV